MRQVKPSCQDKFTRAVSFLVLPSLPHTGHDIIRAMATRVSKQLY